MTQKSIVIKSALDARQAAYFVQTAGKFEAEIHVSVDEKKINAKSIMGTIALNMQKAKMKQQQWKNWLQYWHNQPQSYFYT